MHDDSDSTPAYFENNLWGILSAYAEDQGSFVEPEGAEIDIDCVEVKEKASLDKLEIINRVVKQMLLEGEDLDPEFAEIINRRFTEMI